MARWIFIRHGESTANAGRILSGWNDVALTRRGREQAQRAGRLLAEQLQGRSPRVLSSDLQRAHHTAQLAVGVWAEAVGVPVPEVRQEAGLRERCMGVLQGASIDAARRDGRMKPLLRWDDAPEGGESLRALAARCVRVVEQVPLQGETLVFAHGGVIRVLSGMLDRLTTEQIASRRIENAVPMIQTVSPGVWRDCRERYGLSGG